MMASCYVLLLCIASATALPSLLRRQSFDPTLQHVDVTGAHAYIPPGPSDLRGPCPAMNAAANHGYIARNGYTNLQESINAVTKIYGTGYDLAFILATLGAVQAGDGNHFSIGGPPGNTFPVVGGLLGQPRGISYSHNRFEGDASPMRGDLYQFGEAYLTQLPFFQGLYDLPGAGAVNPNYDLDVMGNYAVVRYHQSVSQNPYYFRGFFGFFIPPGTFAFVFRMFANHSAAYPAGFLDRGTLKSFYGITDAGSSLTYTPGTERIPDNWYTRAVSDQYTVPSLISDIKTLLQEHPELVAFGGNTGTVNSFAGLNIANLTGGLYNAETLLQGNNLGCFLFQSVAVAAPDVIRNAGIIADIAGAISQVNNAIAGAVSTLGCPQLTKYDFDESQLNKYPGYTKLRKDGTYS